MSNIKVYKVRELIIDDLDDFIDYGGKLPPQFEQTKVIYNNGTKKYLDRKNKVVWIEHRSYAFKYKDFSKEYYQCKWEHNNSDDTFILPDRVVTALEIIANSNIQPNSKNARKTLFKHYHSKKCRDLRRGVNKTLDNTVLF